MNCLRVARRLHSYLDGETDEVTARGIAAHLEACRRCGLEASVYQEIHNALARRTAPDPEALDRLYAFGQSLLDGREAGEEGREGSPSPPASA